jgi:rubrerythrin
MSLINLFDLAIELEKKVGDCYVRMGAMATDEALKKDLLKLAQEEVGHANLLRTGRSFGVRNPEFFSRADVDFTLLQNCRRAIAELLGELDRGAIALPAALSRITDLEYFCEKAHLATLVQIEEPSLKPLFEGLARDDVQHGDRVSELLRKFPSPA